MLYLGHFSFSQDMARQDPKEVKPWHGYLTTVAEAPDADAAIRKFRRLLRKLGGTEMLEGVREIYLDACVEIRTVPARGFLAHYSSHAGEDLGGISTSVVGVKESEATVFDLGDDDSEEEQTVEPFHRVGSWAEARITAARTGRADVGEAPVAPGHYRAECFRMKLAR